MDTDARTSAAAIRQHLIEKAARLPERPALAVALAIRVVKRPFAPPLPASLLSSPAMSPRMPPSALVTMPVSLILISNIGPMRSLGNPRQTFVRRDHCWSHFVGDVLLHGL